MTAHIDTIISAPEEHLRAVVKALCTADPKLCACVAKQLTAVSAFNLAASNKKRKADGSEAAGSDRTSKRTKLIDDVRHCARCDKVFSQSENYKRAWWYHPCES